MKHLIKKAIRRVAGSMMAREYRSEYASAQEVQAGLLAQYIAMRGLSPNKLPSFSDIGFQKYSQFEEDGILLYVFGLIGTTNKKVVELCAGAGNECMAANLIINHGWHGYLFDGSEQNVRSGSEFFGRRTGLWLNRPTFKQAWVDAETVNQTLLEADATGQVDLLSLDLDGMDYWVWKAIDAISPRVCIFETDSYIPADKALTVPYKRDFAMATTGPQQYFRGASTLAMVNLSRAKGYRLIGAHRHGFNCIFMKNGVGEEFFPEVTVESIHESQHVRQGMETIWFQISGFDWQKV